MIIGDILLIEEPFATILLPEFYYKCCNRCLSRCDAMVPCMHCSTAMFCSDDCRKKAWDGYHHIECFLMGPLRSLDIYHDILVALRILMIATSPSAYSCLQMLWEKVQYFEKEEEVNINKARTGFSNTGQYSSSDYKATHFLRPNDHTGVLSYAMAAAIIINCLDCFSKFFATPQSSPGDDMDWHVVAGGLLMRYLQMLPPNTYEVKDITYDHTVNELRGSASGHGIYNTSSLLNHSCCNNTSYFFYDGDKHILFASQPIKKGDQLFTNYGSHYVTKELSERRLYLEPYGFTCQCQACVNDWPSAEQLTLHFRLPSVFCSRCKTVIPGTLHTSAVRCPNCSTNVNMKMMMQKCGKIQQRLAEIKDSLFTPKGLKQDFTKELSKLVTEVFETFPRPSLLSILLQNGLNQNMLRYVNYYTPS